MLANSLWYPASEERREFWSLGVAGRNDIPVQLKCGSIGRFGEGRARRGATKRANEARIVETCIVRGFAGEIAKRSALVAVNDFGGMLGKRATVWLFGVELNDCRTQSGHGLYLCL